MSNEQSTSGNREYASMATNKYSPEGKGPQKSMWTVCQGSGGKGDIWRGSGWLLGPLTWHAMQFLIILCTVSSIPGNQIFSRRSCFVFTRPWWPSCAIDTALSRRAAGTTIRLSRRMTLVSWLTVSSCRTCSLHMHEQGRRKLFQRGVAKVYIPHVVSRGD